MNLSRWKIAAAIGIGFLPSFVYAQSAGYARYLQPQPVLGEVTASDVPTAPATISPPPMGPAAPYQPEAVGPDYAADGCTSAGCTGAPGCASCPDGGCEGCALECPEVEDPWRMFGNCCGLQERGLNLKGWIAGGVFANPDSPASNFNGPVTFNDRDSEFQLNQLYVIGEKPIDTSACDWDIGGRIDVLYGSDYRYNISRGLSARDNFTAKWDSGRFYGLDVPQAYAEVGYKNLSVKLGHFYTIIGYQVFTSPDNFFYSIPYTFQYGEPFTHTGALATWTANDQLTLMGGITNGWNNFEDALGHTSFIGGATFSSSDGNDKLALAAHIGKDETTFGQPDGSIAQRWVYSAVYSRTITDRLQYVFQHDNGRQDNYLNTGEQAQWYGINQYLFYKIDCCWTAGLRAEWFRDDDGFRVAAPGDYAALGFSNNPASAGGWAGNFYDVALGLNWKPNGNLTVRPEVRYDWYSGNGGLNGVNDPYDDGDSSHQWLYGFDLVYLF